MKPVSRWSGITPYQWLVLFVAWLGWVFDAMDATIYAIVLHPALHELLHSSAGPPTTEQVGWYGGIIFSLFPIGWAVGDITFGVLADRFGRTKVLITTIIIYAVFTGAAALAETWWQLALSRFLTAIGIGGGNGRPAQRSSPRPGRMINAPRRPAYCNRPGRSGSSWQPASICS